MKYEVMLLAGGTADFIAHLNSSFPINSGESRIFDYYQWEPGGEGNTLIAYSRMGGSIVPVGAFSDDIYGSFVLDAYRKEGIDTDLLQIIHGLPSVVSLCLVDENGKHSFLSNQHVSNGLSQDLVLSQMDDTKAIFISGYYLGLDNSNQELCLKLMKKARASGKAVFFDPGPMVVNLGDEILQVIFTCSTVICLNEEEAGQLSGEKEPEKAAEWIAKRSRAFVVVKCGDKGCYGISQHYNGRWFPGFAVKTIDTMGAGDSFIAGLMYGWMHQWQVEDSLTLANAAGAVKVTKLGNGTKVPTFDELVSMLETHGYFVNSESKEAHRFIDCHFARR